MTNNFLSLIEIEADIAGQTRGSALSARALRQIAHKQKSHFYQEVSLAYRLELIRKKVNENTFVQAKYIDELLPFYKKNIPLIGSALQKTKFSLIVSGDHANAISVIASLQKTYPKKKLGIVWLDAHADIHNPFTSPSGNLHGMSLGVFFNQFVAQGSEQKKDSRIKKYWQQLCKLGNEKVVISNEHLVYVGLRSVEREEKQVIVDKKISVFDVIEIRKKKIENVVKQIAHQLQNCDMVYISLDADVLDPTVSKGTGTPVNGGLTKAELQKIVLLLIAQLRVKVIEVTEINPLLDTENKMAEHVFGLMEQVVHQLKAK